MFASREHDETIVTAYQCWRPGVASYRGWYLVRLDGERVSVADIDLATDGVPDGNLAA